MECESLWPIVLQRVSNSSVVRLDSGRKNIIRLHDMDEEERMKIFIIQTGTKETEPNLIEVFLRLYWSISWNEREPTLVALKKDNYIDDIQKMSTNEKFIDEFFDFRKSTKHNRMTHLQEKPQPEKLNAESKLLQSLRVCSLENFSDTIFVDRELVKNFDKLMEIFDKISNYKIFTELPDLHLTQLLSTPTSSTKTDPNKSDPWFDFWSHNTLGSIFLGLLEYFIFYRYLLMTRYINSQKKESWLSADIALPWKFYKEMSLLVKEYNAMGIGINILESTVAEECLWLEEEEKKVTLKNPIRMRQIFRLAYISNPSSNFKKLKNKEELVQELENILKLESREKTFEAIMCPLLDQFGEVNYFILHSISKRWIDAISNIRIQKFQEAEDKKSKKKKKKPKKKKSQTAEPDYGEGPRNIPKKLSIDDSLDKSIPMTKTNGDEDTKCANTTNLSYDKLDDLHQVDFKSEKMHNEEEDTGVMVYIERNTPRYRKANKNLINNKMSKEEFKREKKKLKKKQRTEAAKLKKLIVPTSSDSFGSCSPLEKASCLSVAGSGVMMVSEDRTIKNSRVEETGNLIVKQKATSMEEDSKRYPSKCKSLNSSSNEEDDKSNKALSVELKKRVSITKYDLYKEPKNDKENKEPQKLKPLKKLTSSFLFESNEQPTKTRKASSSVMNHTDQSKPKEDMNTNCGTSLKASKGNYKKKLTPTSGSIGMNAIVDYNRPMDFKVQYKRLSKAVQAKAQNFDTIETSSGYKRRTTNSTAADKNSYKANKSKYEKRYEQRMDDRSQADSSHNLCVDTCSSKAVDNSSVKHAEALLLSESLGLANLMDSSGQFVYDLMTKSFEDDHFGQGLNLPQPAMPFMCQIKEEQLNIIEVPDSLVQHPTIQYLESQVQSFFKEMTDHSDRLERARSISKQRIDQVARLSFSGADDLELKTYGSWDTGLSIPGSDIDLMISTPGVDKEISIKMLEILEENLKEFKWASGIRNILTAQIPVLKLEVDATVEFDRTGFTPDTISDEFLVQVNSLVKDSGFIAESKEITTINVDLIVETPDISAMETTQYVKNSICKWPELRPLVLLLKYFLSLKNLSNPYTGRHV